MGSSWQHEIAHGNGWGEREKKKATGGEKIEKQWFYLMSYFYSWENSGTRRDDVCSRSGMALGPLILSLEVSHYAMLPPGGRGGWEAKGLRCSLHWGLNCAHSPLTSPSLIEETELCLTSLWTLCRPQCTPCRAFQCVACIWEAREVEHEVHTSVSFHKAEYQISQSLKTKMSQSPIILLLTDRRNPCSPCSILCWVRNHQDTVHLQSALFSNQGGVAGGSHSILIIRTACTSLQPSCFLEFCCTCQPVWYSW